MKKVIVSCILIITLMFNGCSGAKNKIAINDTKNIIKITVHAQPNKDSSVKSTANKNLIADIVSYINDLDLKKTNKDAGQHDGMSYIITIYYADNTSKEYNHFGNAFFKESGKDWYEMSYKQAEKFESIYKSMEN